MVYSQQREILIKRLPTVIDRAWDVQNYDVDNLYPQRADEVRRRSYTLNSAVEVLAEFLSGDGFADKLLADLVMNPDGETANDILGRIAEDKAPFKGFALHVQYNANYKIAQVTPLEFMYCRFGLPDDDGNPSCIQYNINWEMDNYKVMDTAIRIDSYPLFNPDPNVVKSQMEGCGGFFNYPGQILYWTPKPGMYPGASFDPVFDNAQSQSEIGVFELSSIQNDFGISKIVKYPGTFDTNEERLKFRETIDPHIGPRGAKSTLIVEVPDERQNFDLVEDVQMQNTDKMFEFTSKNVKNAIRESMKVPACLIGQLPENGMFNKEQIAEAYTYFNAITRRQRTQISRVFQRILAHWWQPITVSTFDIIEQVYGTPAAKNGQPGQTPTDQNTNISSMTGKQSQNLRRVQRQYDKGQISLKQAIAELTLGFGITEEQAKRLLDDDETNDPVLK